MYKTWFNRKHASSCSNFKELNFTLRNLKELKLLPIYIS